MTTFLATCIYIGGIFGARSMGAHWHNACAWPANLGYAIGKWALKHGGDL